MYREREDKKTKKKKSGTLQLTVIKLKDLFLTLNLKSIRLLNVIVTPL